MELQVGVKAFIQNEEGKYLVMLRVKPYAGGAKPRWDIPGGRITPGEPLLQALAREIQEETRMTMQGEPRILYAQDILRNEGLHVVRLTFLAEAQGDVQLDGKEHSEYRWVTLVEFKTMDHDKYLTPVLDILKK